MKRQATYTVSNVKSLSLLKKYIYCDMTLSPIFKNYVYITCLSGNKIQLKWVMRCEVNDFSFTPLIARQGIPQIGFSHCTHVENQTRSSAWEANTLTTRLPHHSTQDTCYHSTCYSNPYLFMKTEYFICVSLVCTLKIKFHSYNTRYKLKCATTSRSATYERQYPI